MEKLFLWFNCNTEQYYFRICRNSDYKIGDYNQYNHLLLDVYEFYNDEFYSLLSPGHKQRIRAEYYANKH